MVAANALLSGQRYVKNECSVCALLHAEQACSPLYCTTAAVAAAEQHYCRLRH